jgi:hypothetical protein
MNTGSKLPFETLGFKLPTAVAEVFYRRVASHNWDSDRVVSAAILYFIENADARPDMLRRLIEVQSGQPPQTSPGDVLEHHRDEVFSDAVSDVVDGPASAVVDVRPQSLAEVTVTLDEIAENLARCNDEAPDLPL